jgi:hypothetical protein
LVTACSNFENSGYCIVARAASISIRADARGAAAFLAKQVRAQ